jgi:parvulin-like peptidyl-prolyl isomerase
MREKPILFFVLMMIFAACSPSESKSEKSTPKQILSTDKMAHVIADIQIAEALLREKRQTGQPTDGPAVDYMNEIFEKHNTTLEKYRQSLKYYENNLEQYEQVYAKVITLLMQKQTQLTNPEK